MNSYLKSTIKFISAALFLIFVGIFLYSADLTKGLGIASLTNHRKAAVIEILKGAAQIKVAGSNTWILAVNGQEIPKGASVRTSTHGISEITYPTGTVTRLDYNTQIQLQEFVGTPTQVSVYISKGRIWSSVIKLLGGESYQSESSKMVAVVRGTAYGHAVGPGGVDQIIVSESKVEVNCINLSENKKAVTAGNMVSTNCTGLMADPVKTTSEIIESNWIQENIKMDNVSHTKSLLNPHPSKDIVDQSNKNEEDEKEIQFEEPSNEARDPHTKPLRDVSGEQSETDKSEEEIISPSATPVPESSETPISSPNPSPTPII